MDRKERILAFINSDGYVPLKTEELMTVLDVPKNERSELESILNTLCAQGKIVKRKRNRFAPVRSDGEYVTGRLECSAKGYFGFIIRENGGEDVFVNGDDMLDALDGDTVRARLYIRRRGCVDTRHKEARVTEVIKRGYKTITGVIYSERNGYFYLRPDNRRIYAKFLIKRSDAMNVSIGDRAAMNIVSHDGDGKFYGRIVSVLGNESSLKSIVEALLISNGIKRDFDEQTLREANEIEYKIDLKQLADREDLRDELIFTIDGDDARDFDDAVSLKRLNNGSYLLGVHIADVSEYVREGSALDSEAFERGTSVYLADRVIPMLPERLSNGICSLNPNEDRLAMSLFTEISTDGNVVNHRLVKSVICSSYRMTYNNVNKILSDNDVKLCAEYAELVPTLRLMEKLAEILREKRLKRGCVQFDFPESKIIVSPDGDPIDIIKEERGVSNKMIEEFMLTANETIAEYAFASEIPFIYRNHEPPDTEKIRHLNKLLRRFGDEVIINEKNDASVPSEELRRVVSNAEGTPQERVVSDAVLRSMMKAGYSERNLGHYGLGAQYYCHFTSPIRRYPDLAVHRILKEFADGKLTAKRRRTLQGFTAAAGKMSSEREINAENTERAADDVMKAAYMSAFIGTEFDAVVTNVTSFGMFVELDNSVEGLIKIENMAHDSYEYDENLLAIIGRRKGNTFSMGDRVQAVLVKCDIPLGQLEFILKKDYNDVRDNGKTVKAKTVRGSKRKKYKRYSRKKNNYGKIRDCNHNAFRA